MLLIDKKSYLHSCWSVKVLLHLWKCSEGSIDQCADTTSLSPLVSIKVKYVQIYSGLHSTWQTYKGMKISSRIMFTCTVLWTPSTSTDNRGEAKFHSPVTLSFIPSTSTCCEIKENCYHESRPETDLKFITAYKGATILKQMAPKQPVMFTASATKDRV